MAAVPTNRAAPLPSPCAHPRVLDSGGLYMDQLQEELLVSQSLRRKFIAPAVSRVGTAAEPSNNTYHEPPLRSRIDLRTVNLKFTTAGPLFSRLSLMHNHVIYLADQFFSPETPSCHFRNTWQISHAKP